MQTQKDAWMKALVRFLIVVLIMVMIAPAVASAQETFTTGSLSWQQFVNAVGMADRSKINFSCSSLVHTMNASYDLGDYSCGDFADRHMKSLVEADCPKEAVYVAQVRNGEVVDDPIPANFIGQECMWSNAPRRVEFTASGVPIVVAKSLRRTGARSTMAVATTKEPKVPAAPLVRTVAHTDTLHEVDTVSRYVDRPVIVPVAAPAAKKENRSCWRWSSWCPWATLVGLAGAGYAGYECAHVWCVNHVVVNSGSSAYASASRRPRSFGVGFNANPAKVERLVGLILRR